MNKANIAKGLTIHRRSLKGRWENEGKEERRGVASIEPMGLLRCRIGNSSSSSNWDPSMDFSSTSIVFIREFGWLDMDGGWFIRWLAAEGFF